MNPRTARITGVFVVLSVSVSRADIRVTVERRRNAEATSDFDFRSVPSPSRSDAATGAAFTIVEGRRDPNGGKPGKLCDGHVASDSDQPSENSLFAAGTDGGRLVVDLERELAGEDE